MFMYVLCLVSCLVYGTNSAAAPFITPCKPGDDACLLNSCQAAIPHITAGVPDLGVPSLDPLSIDKVNGDNGELKLTFTDFKITGLKDCKMISASLPDKINLEFAIQCPIHIVGQYIIGGKLTLLPVEGEGPFDIHADNIQLNVKAQLAESDGHVTVNSFDYTYDPIEKVNFKFDNLFKGDESKAKPIHDILNDSGTGKDIIKGVGKPLVDELVVHVKDNILKFFAAVPYSELFA